MSATIGPPLSIASLTCLFASRIKSFFSLSMPSSELPLSFRSKGGARFPPRKPAAPPSSRLEGPQLDAYENMKNSLVSSSSPSLASLGKRAGMSARLSERRINKLQSIAAGQDVKANLRKQRSIVEQKVGASVWVGLKLGWVGARARCWRRLFF